MRGIGSGDRLHSSRQVRPPHAQHHLRHNTVDLVRTQLMTTDLVETEEYIIYNVIHFLQAHIVFLQGLVTKI